TKKKKPARAGEAEKVAIKMASSKQLGVMVVGAGDVSKNYFGHCQRDERTRIVAVADPNHEALRRAEQTYRPDVVAEDYKELLGREDIGVVVVLTPHHLHYPVVMDALKAGKDVICEKPITVSVGQADEMIDFARKCGRKFLVTLNSQFTPRSFKIREILSRKLLGEVFMAHVAYLGYEYARMADPNHWKGDSAKAGGGVLLDGGYHIVDLANSFLGRARYVQAAGGRYVVEAPQKGEDNITLLVEYAGGAVADLQVSFTACNVGCDRAPTLMIDIDLYGADGSLRYGYGWDAVEIREEMELLRPQKGRETIDLSQGDYPDCYSHFFDCLIQDAKPIVTPMHARNALAVVEAAYESMRSGRKIEVNWRS
ncbi:MAG: Gfo/Idh/MocA family oxidoreductase, partial [Planctomycetota bacterium]|nr:Gfo/Idh/MocA family oxidoreductase [Planctomycetota bacterium]